MSNNSLLISIILMKADGQRLQRLSRARTQAQSVSATSSKVHNLCVCVYIYIYMCIHCIRRRRRRRRRSPRSRIDVAIHPLPLSPSTCFEQDELRRLDPAFARLSAGNRPVRGLTSGVLLTGNRTRVRDPRGQGRRPCGIGG